MSLSKSTASKTGPRRTITPAHAGPPLQFCYFIIAILGVAIFCGCAHQTTLDTKIYRIGTVSGTNYYRVRILSDAWNSKTSYKPGLFPAYAVDAFLGTQADMPMEAVDAEAQMRKKLVTAQQEAFQAYLTAVKAGKEAEIERAAQGLLLVQELPFVTMARTNFSSRILFTPLEFSPIRSLADHTANKKYVIALAANPDAILKNISALAEEPATTKAVTEALTGFVATVRNPESGQKARTQLQTKTLIETLQELIKENVTTAEQLQRVINEAIAAAETLP
jgi:hypothetical protein